MRIALAGTALAVLLAGCATPPPRRPAPRRAPRPRRIAARAGARRRRRSTTPTTARRWCVPADLDAIPDAVPRLEPLHRFANRPYTVLGRDYVPATMLRPYRERGVA